MCQIYTAIDSSSGGLFAPFVLNFRYKKSGYTLSMGKESGHLKKDAGTPLLVVGTSAKSGISLLDGREFSATHCLDACEALQILRLGRYQAVLCDLELPGEGGMMLVSSVQAGFPDVAVVVITRPGKLRNGILAMMAGASGYIQAPLQPEIVTASLRSAMRRKQLDSAMRG